MTALFRKELRALMGVLIVALMLMSGDMVSRPFTERIDELPWIEVSPDLTGDSGFFAFMLMVLALITAYAAYPREHDERTIEMLYALPIGRGTVFATKVMAGLSVLWLALISGAVTNALLTGTNPQSLTGGQWHAGTAVLAVVLRGLFITIMYFHGMLISVLRRFGLIPFFILMLIVLRLAEASPAFEILDPSNIIAYSFDGRQLLFPGRSLALHLPIAMVSLLAAAFLWMGAGGRLSATFDQARQSTGGKVAMGCGTAALLGTALIGSVILLAPSGGSAPKRDEPADHVSFETDTAETEHFSFTFPVSLRVRAEGLIGRSEKLYAALLEVSGVKGEPPKVVVDLTDEGGSHLGIAAWTKIRIALARHSDDADLDRTFVHELAHVLQHLQSDRRMSDESEAVGFFAEGSAEFLALEVTGRDADDTTRRASRQIAAASWQRHRIRFEELSRSAVLRSRYDFRLEYALGELWAAALAELYSPKAVMQVFATLGRPSAPRDLSPAALWRDTLQHAGYSAEDVRARWEQRMADLAKQEAPFIDALPRLGGGVLRHDERGAVLLITLDRDPPPGSTVMVAVRSHAAVPDASIRDLTATAGADPRKYEVIVPRWLGASERFEYLPGLRPKDSHWAFYETWRSAKR